MLDVARHFFPPETVKRLIDQMAYYKMNVLHLHLSDDQGWRLEIKSWPDLTTIGGSTKVGGGPGGFYSQAEYVDIVNYASSRYITIVPEFDMPGHTNAALASYATLNCNNTATDLYTGTTVGFSALCVSKPLTYQFIEDVIGEVAALTPGPYIHIGGDEASTLQSSDYIEFINKVQSIVSSKGKQMIGWEDVALANIQKNSLAQHWHDGNKATAAVSSGAKIIMSPANRTYLDMKYNSSTTTIGASWAGYISVQSAYDWQIGNFISGIGKENIIGIEAPLWTETIVTSSDIDYMIFPRLLGYSEIGWSSESTHDWNEYKARLGTHGPRMNAMAINFYPSNEVVWSK
jgi:hexosaminidase